MTIKIISMALGVITLCLSACASTTGIDPSNLDKSTSNNYVVVDEPFSWTERFNISNITHYLTLSAGKYNAKYDNGKAGTYYEGSSNCLRWRVVNDDKSIKGSDNNLRCGVYVPNNTDERVLIYYYIDPEASRKTIAEAGQSGTLIHALYSVKS